MDDEAIRADHWHKAMRAACPFCDYAGPSPILYEDSNAYVIEPMNPVTPGHVLVICRYHIPDFAEDETFTGETMESAAVYARVAEMGDCNLITSKGAAATQTVPHLHVHLVPRFSGDGLHLPWTPREPYTFGPLR